MGTFQGHLLPGTFFISFALWWTVQITKRVFICEQKGIPFYNTVTYSGLCARLRTWPQEGIVKGVATFIGIILEILASTDWGRAGGVVFIGDLQHVTMYLFFFISGIVDILTHKRALCVPPGTDYLASALAFMAEFVLFKFHLHGRTELDVLVHTLLLYAVAGCVVATLIEYNYNGSALAAYVRAWTVLLQGTWFVSVGAILYPPLPFMTHWEHNDHKQMMLATMMFTWHMAGCFIAMLLIATIARSCYKKPWCFVGKGSLEWELTGQYPMVNISRQSMGGRNGDGYLSLLEEEDMLSEEDETVLFDRKLSPDVVG